MRPAPPPLSKVARATATGIFVALVVALIASPPTHSAPLRWLELAAILACGLVALASVVEIVTRHLAGWHESEREFELSVRLSERLATDDVSWDPDEAEFLELDPLNDADFEELVRDALDDLPDLLQNALRHVAVVISNGGRRRGLYGLYEGGVPARIVIFRASLRRDFGGDPDALRDQVTRTVRHELAHHVAFDELGVSELGT